MRTKINYFHNHGNHNIFKNQIFVVPTCIKNKYFPFNMASEKTTIEVMKVLNWFAAHNNTNPEMK